MTALVIDVNRFCYLLPVIFLGGCAHLLNSRRPAYNGPIVKPIWTVDSLACDTTPVIYDGVVYFRARTWTSFDKRLYALDLKTGKKLWTSTFTPAEIKFYINPLLFVTDDQGVAHSLDAKTGKDIFLTGPTKLIAATPVGTNLYAVWADATVTAMDNPKHVIWTAQLPMKFLHAPVVVGENVYVAGETAKDTVKLDCRIHAFNAKTGAELWQWGSGTGGDVVSSLVADAHTVYAWYGLSEGEIVALDVATGKPRWRVKNKQYFAEGPILFDKSTVVARDSQPSGMMFRGLDRASGQVLWESTTIWKYARWTAQDGRLFVADRQAHAMLNEAGDTSPDSWLTAVDIRTGRELWRSPQTDLGDFTEPAVAGGLVVVGSWPYQFQNPRAAFVAAFPELPNEAK